MNIHEKCKGRKFSPGKMYGALNLFRLPPFTSGIFLLNGTLRRPIKWGKDKFLDGRDAAFE